MGTSALHQPKSPTPEPDDGTVNFVGLDEKPDPKPKPEPPSPPPHGVLFVGIEP